MHKPGELVAGFIGVALIAAFLIGLANSIHATPFWFITSGVLALAVTDFYQSCIRPPRQD